MKIFKNFNFVMKLPIMLRILYFSSKYFHAFFRSLSVAFVTVNVTTILDEVMFDTTGTNGSYFDIQVCASFVGRGLEGRSLSELHI